MFTRPDINFVMGVLSRNMQNPHQLHWRCEIDLGSVSSLLCEMGCGFSLIYGNASRW